MSTTLELERDSTTRPTIESTTNPAAQRLRGHFAACRVKFKWFGTSKSLNNDQKCLAAESFGAEGDSISAGKKLIDTKHESYRAVTSLRSQIVNYWKDHSLALPGESATRLIKQDHIESFDTMMHEFQNQLRIAVRELDQHYYQLVEAARIRLGSLFDSSDYPSSLEEAFALTWDFPSVEPPNYLQELNPSLYLEQSERVAQKFERAVEVAEEMFVQELDRLVGHLVERLSGSEDGKPKVFRDSAVNNLSGFFARFRELNVNSNEQLDLLVEKCEDLLRGTNPQTFRDDVGLRTSLTTQLASVQESLDDLLVDRPRRNILRPTQPNPEN